MNTLNKVGTGKVQTWIVKNILGEDVERGNMGYFEDGYLEFDSVNDAIKFITKHKEHIYKAEVNGEFVFNRGLKIDLL